MAKKMQVGPCIPVGIRAYKAEGGPTSGPTRRLSHLRHLPPPQIRVGGPRRTRPVGLAKRGAQPGATNLSPGLSMGSPGRQRVSADWPTVPETLRSIPCSASDLVRACSSGRRSRRPSGSRRRRSAPSHAWAVAPFRRRLVYFIRDDPYKIYYRAPEWLHGRGLSAPVPAPRARSCE